MKWSFILPAAFSVHALCLAGDANTKNDAAIAEVLTGKRADANAAWWGFDPADSTGAVQAAIDSGASKVVVPNMERPWIVRPIFLRRSNQEILFEKGAVIRAKEGEFKGLGDCLFLAQNVRNLVLRGYGATLEMRKQDYWTDEYWGGQWRHTLSLRGCSSVKVLGITTRNSGGDGMYIGRGPKEHLTNEDILVKDCVFDKPHRNGMLVITARRLLIENCVFSEARGHSPMAGFSVEPNRPDELIVDIVVRNCQMLNNDCFGVHIHLYKVLNESAPASIVLEGCHVSGGHLGLHVSGAKSGSAGGKVAFRNCTVENTIKSGLCAREISGDSNMQIVFENIRLKDVSTHKSLPPAAEAVYGQFRTKRTDGHCRCHRPHRCNDTVPNTTSLSANWRRWYPYGPIALWTKSSRRPLCGGITFRNCAVTEEKDIPVFVVAGTGSDGKRAPAEVKGWARISGDIKAENPNGVKADFVVPLIDSDLTINGEPAAQCR